MRHLVPRLRQIVKVPKRPPADMGPQVDLLGRTQAAHALQTEPVFGQRPLDLANIREQFGAHLVCLCAAGCGGGPRDAIQCSQSFLGAPRRAAQLRYQKRQCPLVFRIGQRRLGEWGEHFQRCAALTLLDLLLTMMVPCPQRDFGAPRLDVMMCSLCKLAAVGVMSRCRKMVLRPTVERQLSVKPGSDCRVKTDGLVGWRLHQPQVNQCAQNLLVAAPGIAGLPPHRPTIHRALPLRQATGAGASAP